MSSMLGSGSRMVPSLLAAACGLSAAAVVGAVSYVAFGTGTVGPPQSPRAAALRYAHLLHEGDVKDLDILACQGTRAKSVSQAWPSANIANIANIAWRLEPRQLNAKATSFRFGTTDGARHLQMVTAQSRTGWCVSSVRSS
jgi:hypothetical protein